MRAAMVWLMGVHVDAQLPVTTDLVATGMEPSASLRRGLQEGGNIQCTPQPGCAPGHSTGSCLPEINVHGCDGSDGGYVVELEWLGYCLLARHVADRPATAVKSAASFLARLAAGRGPAGPSALNGLSVP
jgi:hypothetical protein